MLLFGENLLLAVLALVPGLGLGVPVQLAAHAGVRDRPLSLPLRALTADTLFRPVVITLAFAVLANLAVLRRLRRLDLVEVLKARE